MGMGSGFALPDELGDTARRRRRIFKTRDAPWLTSEYSSSSGRQAKVERWRRDMRSTRGRWATDRKQAHQWGYSWYERRNARRYDFSWRAGNASQPVPYLDCPVRRRYRRKRPMKHRVLPPDTSELTRLEQLCCPPETWHRVVDPEGTAVAFVPDGVLAQQIADFLNEQ